MIYSKFSLKSYNSFALKSRAQYFAQPKTISEVLRALDFADQKNLKIYPLGIGSNILLQKNQPDLVIKNSMQKTEILENNSDFQIWRVEAGVNWHWLVMQSVEQNLFGLERLALIPSSVGAAPVQNIGAYGTEIKQSIEKIEVLTKDGQIKILSNKECEFGYRNSVFKAKRQYLIIAVYFKLHKAPVAFLQDYANLNLSEKTTSASVAQEIMKIRSTKLPDPKKLPNVGSFFKNPVINKDLFKNLTGAYADIPSFVAKNGIKIPAAWLIEKLGFKGKKYKNLAMFENQALVMVKYGDADLQDILNFASKIQNQVKSTFDINLEIEPEKLKPIF